MKIHILHIYHIVIKYLFDRILIPVSIPTEKMNVHKNKRGKNPKIYHPYLNARLVGIFRITIAKYIVPKWNDINYHNA